MNKIVLASCSPRRREILAELCAEFEVVPPGIEEDMPETGDPREISEELAAQKALSVAELRKGDLIIAGDTIVAVPEGRSFRLLGKPDTAEDVVRMLNMLSGRTHLVVTGLALVRDDWVSVCSEATRVTFRALSPAEIAAYAKTPEPLGKAGAYAIQGYGGTFVETIEGSYTNVVGLPKELLEQTLAEARSALSSSAPS